ncbi:glycerophosphodiester phosphodiesterase [Sphingomonas psychrotolerans]|uniref:glycerophosphodiester phosphodiesterase n=1 Tax=Sphingomonas psychrotolerans TaxID=1327635 RepID=A0A2K8MRS3_9SPHN|nr:glycerophosphodiester phosphodiesterase [Sphingomonas psychrotolerans]ATY34729.1 glycerophosphodiester phosphodiesterase [Sphingomonas psychrotolerans]
MAGSPIVIAHRGASGERPEHTLLAYQLAIEQGADFIEPDLVPTSDGVLVARHENEISGTTDVAAHPEFASRKTSKQIDGAAVTGWFTEDFTLAELKTLRAKERLPQLRPGNMRYDGQAEIPTLDEIIALAKQASRATGRTIGIYPETKHPSYFAAIGLPLEERLIAALHSAGWDRADAPVFIQSFEVANLKKLKSMTRVPLIQLMSASGGPADGAEPSYAAMAMPAGLARIAGYAAGIGPERTMILPASGPATSLVADAHAAGLKVHPWTFRAENFFLLPAYRTAGGPAEQGRLAEEIAYFIGLGVDGFFSDYPYIGVTARASASASPAHRK